MPGVRHAAPATAHVDYVENTNILRTEFRGEDVRVVARLVDGRLDRKVWVGEYRVPRSEIAEAARKIAAESASAVTELLR